MSDSEDDLIGDPNDIDNIVEGQADDLEGEDGDEDNDNNQATENADGGDGEAVPPAPVKKKVSRPQPKLDPERLKGPRGIATIEHYFKDFKFHGKGYEKHDLNMLLKRLEHWAHRLYPRFQFEDCLEKIEKLGHKKIVQVYVKKIRLGMETGEDVVRLVDEEEEDDPSPVNEPTDNTATPIDAFDELLNQQLAKAKYSESSAPSTPLTPVTVPSVDKPINGDTSILTPEQRERMLRNRVLAEERRLARLKAKHEEEQRLLSLTGKSADNIETILETASQNNADASESLLRNFHNETVVPDVEMQNIPEVIGDSGLDNSIVAEEGRPKMFENKNRSLEEKMPEKLEISQNVSCVGKENSPDTLENSSAGKSHISSINKVSENETGIYENLETVCIESTEEGSRNAEPIDESSVLSLCDTIKLADNVETILETASQNNTDASESLLRSFHNKTVEPEDVEMQNIPEIIGDSGLENCTVAEEGKPKMFESKSPSLEEKMPEKLEISQNESGVGEENVPSSLENSSAEKSHISSINKVSENETGIYENLETVCIESTEEGSRNAEPFDESSVLSLCDSVVSKNGDNQPELYKENIEQIKEKENMNKLKDDNCTEGSISLLDNMCHSEVLADDNKCEISDNSAVLCLSPKTSVRDNGEIVQTIAPHSNSTEDRLNSSQSPSRALPDMPMDVDEPTQFVLDSMDVDATQFTPQE